MKLSELNEWLALVANIGVLLGIIFLAVELQQNTNMMRAQTRNEMTQNLVGIMQPVSDNPYMVDIFTRGFSGELVPGEGTEWASWRFYAEMNLRNWENEWYQNRQGLFEEDEYLPRRSRWVSAMQQSPGMRAVWSVVKSSYSPGFAAELDSLL